MADAQTVMFERKNSYTISQFTAFFIVALFLIILVVTGVLVYYFAPCPEAIEDNDTLLKGSLTDKTNIYVKLPTAVVPKFYDLWLIPFIWEGNFTFHGEIKILVNVTKDTNNVTLHAVDIKIDENFTSIREYLTINSHKSNEIEEIGIVEQRNDTVRQFHVIKTSKTLRKGKQYVVHLKFIGYLNDYLQGFYRSSYNKVDNQTRWIATSHFEPTNARRAFPCFDEPALKAQFQINIARPRNMTSISNMPRQGKSMPVSGLNTYVWDHYKRSVPMSTYLVAFIVFDFDAWKSQDGNFSVWARHDAINQSRYSLNIGPKVLKFYEDYFKIKFPLPKMDMVALPDFSAGAMENWGLITYRETALLYKEGISNSVSKQRVATVVSHELAHQWFGNLVTPSWWTDLWLNEGFASYMEYIGTDAVEPTWNMMEQFIFDKIQYSFGFDTLESSHPVSIEVGNPEEINEIFDEVCYEKGASIIRMMEHFLTTEVFKKGLTNYLNKKAYQNAEQNDLWYALTKQAHKDKVLDSNITVKNIMDSWTLQTGFPVVTVVRNYNNSNITLTQERFLLNDNDTTTKSESLWWIPITYTSQKQLNFSNTRPMKWMKAKRSIILNNLDVSPSQWVLFNVQETGYYRVNYDRANWQMIIKQLNKQNFKDISTINRAQLIDDALNLARAGKLNYTIAFNVTSYLVCETEYLPWKAAFNALSYLNDMLIYTRSYDKFRSLILKLLDTNVYKQVGFTDELTDSQLTILTRIEVLTWACNFDHEDCIMRAVQQFDYWRTVYNPDTDNPISPNLRSVIYCTAIRMGGRGEWEFVWQRYQKSNVGSEKNLLLQALACTREMWLLNRLLDWAVTEDSGIRKQDATGVFASVANNIAGESLIFDYFINNWAHIKKYLGISSLKEIIKSATKRLNTKYKLKDIKEFMRKHLDELGSARRTILQAIEQVESNIRWLDKYHGQIYNWLQKNIV
ncbi:PREDICTED: aminopeptidase N-like [Vollenhovia emeryi]|uniref:aminopeptidase N-like n=1 Tax=Vollenhovia emeryi TaxID=411798 RepID=UPI0005F571A5|nr:PREDICTED: aminopeptidase N-like [Vollenhovia emeryi]